MFRARAALALGLAALAGAARADEPAVTYAGNALSVRCADAPLATVLERIQAATGVVLIVEGTGGTTRLTADVPALPVAQAIARLLEGTGVGYLLVADPADASRIATVYVTDDKPPGAAASAAVPHPAAPPARRAATLPGALPQAVADAIAEAEAEAASDDDQEVTTETPPVTVEAPPAPPAPGFHAVLDPFGRPIPTREGAQQRRARKGVSGEQ